MSAECQRVVFLFVDSRSRWPDQGETTAMFADREQHSRSFDRTRRRVGAAVWTAGLSAALGTGLAAAPASAQAPPTASTMFVQTAQSGELQGKRLTLDGVRRRATWATHGGRFGVLPVNRLHQLVFSSQTPAATGTLHMAGNQRTDVLTLKLSRPRYNAARRTVSYRFKQLGNGRLPSRAARAAGAARRFGPASLSILGAQATDGPSLTFQNNTYGCGQGDGTCWGTVSASGLVPNSFVGVSYETSNGGGGQNNYQVDGNGNLAPLQLFFACETIESAAAGGDTPDGQGVYASQGSPRC
jgi:hypothetical protein